MSYFAAGLVRTPNGWSGRELDLDDVTDIDGLTEALRDLADEAEADLALLLVEEDDEWVGLVRVDDADGARVFLSDSRAAASSPIAAVLAEDAEELEAPPPEDEEESARPEAEPIGDAGLLADLGLPAARLLRLCAEEGLLPADVLSRVCESAGCLEVLEELREG